MDKADVDADVRQVTALVELILGGLTELGFYLCENDPDGGASHGIGRALVETAAGVLKDSDPQWV